jgi:hypothetical protein
MVGCSGDDTSNKDGGPDVTTDNQQPDVTNDNGQPDTSMTDGSGIDGGTAVGKFKSDIAMAFCTRYQNCCNGADAGPFDLNKCLQTAGNSAWNGSSVELNNAEVVNGPNVQLDNTAAQACLAGLATLSCPIITSSGMTPEFKTVTDNCYKAVTGKLGAGSNCINSQECQITEYCKFAGVDAGKSDGGSTLGQCATLVSQGTLCGQTPPYGDPVYSSEECSYKGWQSSGNFCDYDTFPDASGYKCQPLRANNAACFADNECASGMCGNLNQDCINTACSCLTSRDYTPFCKALQIKDAGPG